jgi:hypothetical protein
MLRIAMLAFALAVMGAAVAPAYASGTTTPENTCKRGMVYDTKAGKCVKKR